MLTLLGRIDLSITNLIKDGISRDFLITRSLLMIRAIAFNLHKTKQPRCTHQGRVGEINFERDEKLKLLAHCKGN